MLRETDFARQRQLMRQFEKLVLDIEAHEIFLLWRYRIVPYPSYVKGWKVSPSHYVNQDTGNNLARQVGRRLSRTVSIAVADRRTNSVCHVTDVERT